MHISNHHPFQVRHNPCRHRHPLHCRPAAQTHPMAELGQRSRAGESLQEGWQGLVRVENGQSFQGLSVANNQASWHGISKDGSTITTPEGSFTTPSRSLVIREEGSREGVAYVPSTDGPAGPHNETYAMKAPWMPCSSTPDPSPS